MKYRDSKLQESYEIANHIKNSTKRTPIKVYIKGNLKDICFSNCKDFGDDNFKIVFGEYSIIKTLIDKYQDSITDFIIEWDRRNSAIPLLNTNTLNARIEPGSIIREKVKIGNKVIVMMGAVINIGAEIGENSMIDMNAVIGARGIIGKNVHIGAGAVIAGVLEPPSKTPVIIEDDVLIGANAVVLEGIKVGKGAVVAAGSVVIKNVPNDTVVAGIPATIIKKKDNNTINKIKILEELRG
ncbi:2,3,4,5-tetrahydropyridine-2,6-dicarboxylate N-acetyltransferase [Clostridium sp. D2Q-14]|uniref:2,3,4,5-tetrahydropyridine-2,6-dicarboxylate N-acetyltransferase n=1 Tax=Anaeromonas gelatinilytica TaxID=2683194 RepID=UPI00193AE5D6|nr:2,3,4,5-tetrahydropyridine-2,6-dicarboxylate N-acetyltransferase [Anaeromonas gelatinilytica]MBS4534169.1 2,3,4,5-tetrahydropyridine-2,6-dicarboxylate N-acetyltransferase [Anaeromonas gelatinilytica]